MAIEQGRFEVQYVIYDGPEDMENTDQVLLNMARKAMYDAYSPYSDFMVGAAIKLDNGVIYSGSNQENASYGLTICAERTVLARVGAEGYIGHVTDLAVIGTGRKFKSETPVPPCGACRQFIKEHEDRGTAPIKITVSGESGKIYQFNGIENLLPLGFGPKDLNLT